MTAYVHLLQVGQHIRVDSDFERGRMPAQIIRFKPSWAPSAYKRDVLVEWATGERGWAPDWACHEPAWDGETGRGCPCKRRAAIIDRIMGRDYV